MFTSILPSQLFLSEEQPHPGEFLWRVEGTFQGLLAGALLGSDIVRVRLLRTKMLDATRYQLVDGNDGTLPYHSWSVSTGDEQWPVLAQGEEAQELLKPYLEGFAFSSTELRLARPLATNERIYGLGERTGPMNKRGQSFPVWNTDPAEPHSPSVIEMYTSIPFYIGLDTDSGRSYGVFLDYTGRSEMDLGKTEASTVTMTIADDQLVIYFFRGPTVAEVLHQYTDLTGRMPLPARWTLGHHQCRWSYMSQHKVLDIARQLRERHHPCDAIWLDIDYMRGYRVFTWNPDTFPQPEQLTKQLHEQGLHLVTIIDPGIKIDDEYPAYQQITQQDYICHYPDGTPFVGSVWPGKCVFPDFSRSAARTWWGGLYQTLVQQGVDGTWNDMNEPALTTIFSPKDEPLQHRTMSDDVVHVAGGDQPAGPDGPELQHRAFHNAYGMEMARASFEGVKRLQPDTRPFVLSRSGTAGMQRYAALWTGDNSSRWEHIRLAMRMCLDMSVNGVPFVGSDVGGFWENGTGELLVRFAQLGALLPFYRNHNAMDNRDQEPWSFGEPYESAYRLATETRYRLLPYLYTLFHQASVDGSPIIRPLYYHFPQDERACDSETEFMVGDALLSAPISEAGVAKREVYLPQGTWFDYWDGTEYPGNGTTTIAAPIERWPLFVRGNTIIPTGPLMQYTDAQPTDPLTFTCYMAGDGLAQYTHYEDDGSTQSYRNGAFAHTAIACRADGDSVTVRIDEQHTGYTPQRTRYEVVVRVGHQVLRSEVQTGQGSITMRF